MDKETFTAVIHQVTIAIAEKPLNMDLASDLNNLFPPGSDVFTEIQQTCEAGIKQGWMCGQEFGGINLDGSLKKSMDIALT